MKHSWKYAISIASLTAMSLTLSGCSEPTETKAAKQASQQTLSVTTDTVVLGQVPMKAVVPGAVVPDQKASLSSRIMGYIKTLDVKVGEKVKRGDLLFSVDSTDVNSQIQQAESGYNQAVAALKDAKLDFDRFSKLFAEDSVSKQQFDKISLQYQVAQQNLSAAQSGLTQAKAQLNYAYVKAPFDGVVVEKMANAGDLAAPGSPIVMIENHSSLSVQTEVAEDLFAVLRAGDEADILMDGQAGVVKGTIYTLVSAANPKTRTHTVKMSLPEMNTINSGTFARISFKRGERQTILIPGPAVIVRAGIQGVFVVQNDQAYFRMVRTGQVIDGQVEIQAGLNLGDEIVIEGNQSLLNGDKVTKNEKTGA